MRKMLYIAAGLLVACGKEDMTELPAPVPTPPKVVNEPIPTPTPTPVVEEDITGYFHKEGNGDVIVVMADLFEYSSHGDNVRNTFRQFQENTTLYNIEGSDTEAFSSINTDTTLIISASSHAGTSGNVILQEYYDAVEVLKSTNALFVSSLENPGVDGANGVDYMFPHAGNAYVIEEDQQALSQTIWVAFMNGNTGWVDLHGGFVEDNLDNIIFVELPEGVNKSTSHATPYLSTIAAKLLAEDLNMTPQELKIKLLEATEQVTTNVRDLRRIEGGSEVYDTELTINVLKL